ncbi:MAG TPA: hypothetical protein VFA27_17965 [Vicinamibacterales bacterium]|nr:hypothetical protein [Vicinamibacterales bacterium]
MDPVLQPYLQFAGEQSERCLCALLDGSTDGTIRTIVARTLCGGARGRHAHAIETDDVRADVVLQLLGRPRRFRRHRNPRRDSS